MRGCCEHLAVSDYIDIYTYITIIEIIEKTRLNIPLHSCVCKVARQAA